MAALTRTLAELVTRIRNRCDQQSSAYVSDTEIGEMVNASYADLWDHILDAGGVELFTQIITESTTAGTQYYTPDTTSGGVKRGYRILGVDVQFQGKWRAIRSLPYTERNRYVDSAGWTGPGDTFYGLVGHDENGEMIVSFYPTPSAVHSYRIHILPVAFEIGALVDLVGLNGWEEYVIADVCAMLAEKEEGDPSRFLARRDRALQRIVWAARNLDDPGVERIREAVNWGEPEPYLHEPLDAD